MSQIRFSNLYKSYEEAQKAADDFINSWGWPYQPSANTNRGDGQNSEYWVVNFSRFDSAD